MGGRWAAGSPLLCCTLLAALLLLTGVHLNAESTASSQSTQDTSTAPPHTSTELSESKEAPSGRLTSVSTEEAKTKISTDSATVSEVPTAINANDSSDSYRTAVTPINTNWVSTNPNTPSVISTVSISTNSEPSISTLSEHTSGPTLSSQPPSSPQTSSLTPSSPTLSSPTQSNTETITKIIETGSTDKIGSTSMNTTASFSNPVTQESTSPFDTKSSPTDGSESKTVSTTPALTPKDTSTTDATTEHNVELPSALSPGSVAAITIIVILLVLVIFGGAAYWKIRHSSYGRLLEDQDYGSLGNYNNPLYDDS